MPKFGNIAISDLAVGYMKELADLPEPFEPQAAERIMLLALGAEICYRHDMAGLHACAATVQHELDLYGIWLMKEAARPDVMAFLIARREWVQTQQRAKAAAHAIAGALKASGLVGDPPLVFPPGFRNPENN